ncbi:MAG: diaminopimelate decarboxylase [Sulfobacillus benefaciens]|uniref:Diaminopimelate decarboxylase n=1 Tax=Sulfobacillus benefaciens TaxID=453960 RepID=A0A2T2XG76_9FIRM|nr:MAG: diaminopimelate decarboxylase [Sulfobacillus benefaciens]
MKPDTFMVDQNRQISIGGVALAYLAEKYGTPLYVLDYETIVHRIKDYQDALSELTPPGQAFYAGKAFLCQAMAGLLEQHQMGLDVVSGGELYTALQAGFNPERIMFHGNVKTREEIAYALTAHVGHIVCDSMDELERIEEEAARIGCQAPVLLRITPGIEAHTHEFIRTGQFDSKFGFGLADGLADRAVKRALTLEHVLLKGFHAHIGSQILEEDPFILNAETLLRYSLGWNQSHGWWPEVLNIGGGFGVRYQPGDHPPRLTTVVSAINELLHELTPKELAVPRIFMEPGRSIIAEAGVTLYRVLVTKSVPGGKRYISVDGGMGDNIRPALYQAEYRAAIDGKVGQDNMETVTVAGRYCETGDVLLKDIALSQAAVDDLLVVFDTGAYNYSMASNYNRVPRPAVVLVHQGQDYLWVARESYQDLVRADSPYAMTLAEFR